MPRKRKEKQKVKIIKKEKVDMHSPKNAKKNNKEIKIEK